MKEKQISTELLKFREQIDEIDRKILNLLGNRIKIITQVGEHKKSQQENFLIRSNREADMIKNLLKISDHSIPKSAIVNIWRKIITSSNILEQEIKIALYNPDQLPDYYYLVREYYGDFVPIINHNSVTNIISEIEKEIVQIGIFPLPKNGDNKNYDHQNWWINFPKNSNIRVFAKIPFIEYQNNDLAQVNNLVAVAAKTAEKSSSDKSLLLIETDRKIDRNQIQIIIEKTGLDGVILNISNSAQIPGINFYLLEIDGFFEEQSAEILALSQNKIRPYIKIIGHYPTPIIC